MNLTPLYDAWLTQLAKQEKITLLLTGVAALAVLTVVLANNRQRKWILLVVVAVANVVTSGLFAVVPPGEITGRLMLSQALWYDEAFTWRVARLPFPRMLDALAGDVHPPLWYVIEWITIRLIGDSESALRIPALAFGVLGVWLVYCLGREMGYSRQVSGASSLLLVYLPGWNYYSYEARMYTLLSCCVLAATIGLFSRRWWLMALGMIGALYTQTMSVFYVVVIGGLAMGVSITLATWRAMRGDTPAGGHGLITRIPVTTLSWLCLVLGIWMPWLAVILVRQIGDVANGFWIPAYSFGGYLLQLYRAIVMTGQPACLQIPALMLGVGLLSLAVWLAWKDRVRGVALLLLALGPAVLMAIVSEMWRPVFLYRALLPSLPFIALSVVVALERIAEKPRYVILSALILCLVLLSGWQSKEGITGPYLAGDVAQVYQDGDIIYHANLASYILLSYYLPEPDYRHAVWPDAGNLSQALTLESQAAMGIPRENSDALDADRLLVLWIETPMSTVAEINAVQSTLALGRARMVKKWNNGNLIESGLWIVEQ